MKAKFYLYSKHLDSDKNDFLIKNPIEIDWLYNICPRKGEEIYFRDFLIKTGVLEVDELVWNVYHVNYIYEDDEFKVEFNLTGD